MTDLWPVLFGVGMVLVSLVSVIFLPEWIGWGRE